VQSAIATSKTDENEITVYAKMTNLEGLKQAASVQGHEQYELKPDTSGMPGRGRVRVRKITIGELIRYENTIKLKSPSEKIDSNKERTIPIDVEYFDAFKTISTTGMIKVRHNFPIGKAVITGISDGETDITHAVQKEGACYEVDVFADPEGNTYSWCKIDIELDAIFGIAFDRMSEDTSLKVIAKLSSLPFAPTEMFIGRMATPEQKKLMDYLYANVFTFKV
jgi:hypothetical protein